MVIGNEVVVAIAQFESLKRFFHLVNFVINLLRFGLINSFAINCSDVRVWRRSQDAHNWKLAIPSDRPRDRDDEY